MKCRICGCTHYNPCTEGCGWVKGEGDLCTTCADFRTQLAWYIVNCNRVSAASLARLLKEALETRI
jgi:hypothetical protein